MKGSPVVAGLRGNLFEVYAHKVLTEGGVFSIRKLVNWGESPQSPTKVEFPKMTKCVFEDLLHCSLSTPAKTYLMP